MLQLAVLADQEIQDVHHATLGILSETGVVLTHPEARKLLAGAGAAVRGERVLLPPDLVEREVGKCPSVVNIRGRDGKTINLGDGALHWHNLGGARDIYEPRAGKRRQAVLKDVCASARLLDALDQVTSVTPTYTPQDVPGALMSLAMYRHTLPHTTKPVQGPGVQTAAEVGYAIQMARVIGPPAEYLTLSVSPVSPLFFPDGIAGAILAVARAGITLVPLPCPTAGTTAPFSLAGALAQQNAEVLACIVLAQLAWPGLPIVYCGRLAMMEPRTGATVWSGIELALMSAATVQIGRRYGLPVNVYGFSTNAHVLDVQNGFERAINAAIPALAGASELSGIGEMTAGVASSHAQMVCDNEMAASINRLRRGFAVNPDSLAVDVVAAAMSGSRNFLGQKHTTRYLRTGELLYTRLAEHRPWEVWNQEGQASMAERAEAEAEKLLAEHCAPPLSQDQERQLDEIMRAAERELQ